MGASPMTKYKLVASAALASGLLVMAQGAAEARIQCDGNFQIVNGIPVSTLYCREWTLAQVARSRGWDVTVDSIRYNETTKARVCRSVGADNRVLEICGPYRTDGGDINLRN